MAKRKRSTPKPKRAAPKSKRPPKKPAQRRHKTVALKGLTPSEVEAMRRHEVAQRKREAKALDDWKRETGQKRGRGKGQARLLREAERAVRNQEVKEQRRERQRRAKRAGSKTGRYSKIPVNTPTSYTRRFKPKKGRSVEKSVLRVRGTGTWQKVVDTLNALPRGTSAYVQVGSGYGAAAKWVGSRVTTPAEAAGWLEGIGLKYQNKIFKASKPEDLFIEVVALREAKGRPVDLEELWDEAAEEAENFEWEDEE